MNTHTCKAKGRRLQQFVRDTLKTLDPKSEYYSRTMGDTGSDIYGGFLVDGVYIECRNLKAYESLNSIKREMEKSENGRWWYITKTNNTKPLVVLPWEEFTRLLSFQRH